MRHEEILKMSQERSKEVSRKTTKSGDATSGRVVLVGTYKGDQLTKWRGWYNYPISDEDLNAETQRGREGGRVSSRAEW